MAHNPLLGSRISLISKKNIRYEGTLYSINEADATVALESVRSYGTEGREKDDPNVTFVPPQDTVHAYLLFRGQDIRDLHVHENVQAAPPTDPAIVSSTVPPDVQEAKAKEKQKHEKAGAEADASKGADDKSGQAPQQGSAAPRSTGRQQQEQQRAGAGRQPKRGSGTQRRQRKVGPASQVGTGASLLNRKARGTVEGGLGPVPTPSGDFDFESNLAEFDKAKISDGESDGDYNSDDDADGGSNVYTKDDFFDSISCDAIDKRDGVDNRLRGAAERSLNLDTFGAVSLGTGRRGGRRHRRGRGGGRGGGGRRGRGGGRGGGRGYDYDSGPGPRQNNRWKREPQSQSS